MQRISLYMGIREMNDVYPTRPHEHKYFMFQVKPAFEAIGMEPTIIYTNTEYAYLSCSCGKVIREKVEQR